MKKIPILLSISIFMISLAFLGYLQWGRNPKAGNTRIEKLNSGYYENISIIANSLYIYDRETFAEQIIQKITSNTLNDIMFSYDLQGYPNGLHITVYMNDYSYRSGDSSFEIRYLQDTGYFSQYNIKDNPEKFVLEIIYH